MLDLGGEGWPAADRIENINVRGVYPGFVEAGTAEQECRDAGRLAEIHEVGELGRAQDEY